MFDRVELFVKEARELASEEALASALAEVSGDLGFRYFALTHHVTARKGRGSIHLHNYPLGWARWFDEQQLGPADPVHRASHLTSVGFAWSRLGEMIALTPRDEQILGLARDEGIGDGFTIPANVPGEAHGSCSFAVSPDERIDETSLPLAQLVGAFAFEAARRIRGVRLIDLRVPRLTDRQRECVIWAARGKSDWEISKILGVSHETVIQHVKQARERYGVGKRTLLAVHALFDGNIAFLDVFRG